MAELNDLPEVETEIAELSHLDFSRFADCVAIVGLYLRLQIIEAIVTDDEFARRVFKAYSATAKNRIVKTLLDPESSVEVN